MIRSSMAMKTAACAGHSFRLRQERPVKASRQQRGLRETRSDMVPGRGPLMKAFLLAGGLGTRLRPLTDSIPKCLLSVRGTPMMQIWFDFCRRHGIDEV